MRSPIETLKTEFLRRHAKNPGYSLRAFSKLVGVPSGRVSQLFSGKRQLTVGLGLKFSEALGFSPEESRRFVSAIASSRERSSKPATSPLLELVRNKERESILLSESEEAIVCDPMHFTIIALMETKDFRSDAAWIAGRLRSNSVEVREAIENLKKVGLIQQHRNGKLFLPKARNGLVKTRSDVSSKALQKAHRKIMQEATDAMRLVNVMQRDMSSMTIAIDRRHLPRAKELIKDFRRKLATMLEDGDQTEVYRLAIQLFPVTNLRELKPIQELQ